MARLVVFLLALGLPAAALAQPQQPRTNPQAPVWAFTNGLWYDGAGGFTDGTRYAVDGVFWAERPAQVDSTLDLGGGYVVPPFGDAHSHTLGAGGYALRLAETVYLRDGVFYGLDLTNPFSNIEGTRAAFAQPGTLDAAFALGGLSTASGTRPHPATVMELVYGDDETEEDWSLEGDAYWFMESLQDVAAKWPRFLAQRPDVVKVYLMRTGTGPEGCGVGLCPGVLRDLVARSHAVGLRVFAHVNTAADVALALEAGVDALAHIPLGDDGIAASESGPYTLSPETIAEIGARRLVVTPTALLLARGQDAFRTDTLQQEVALLREQLQGLHAAGARIALSGHDWQVTSLREALFLDAYDVFDPATILDLWAVTTPQAIFPGRAIGRLEPGYEASFLVLAGNPVQDFRAVQEITLRVKQGERVGPAE